MTHRIALIAAAALAASSPAIAQTHEHGSHQAQAPAPPTPSHRHDAPAPTRPQPPAPAPHAGAEDNSSTPQPSHHDHAGMHHEEQAPAATAPPAAAAAEHGDHGRMPATGIYGPYAMGRDASGTSWQPDISTHGGLHAQRGDWSLMGHLLLNGVYAWSEGARGDEKAFISGMVMGAARRDFANGDALNFRVMLSPDPFMGKSGYPLLFAAGESADGVEPLVDRQHPHDLFMELSASYAHRLGADSSLFVYGGLPGEPAFGPPAFMHRLSAMDSPEAPITHHWFDSTHITFGVITVGLVHGAWKLEASRFRGREPDEDRFDIETGELDSSSVRASWNPTENLALQASWADITSPEALEPDHDEKRWSVSGIYTRPIGGDGWWSTTLAFSNKERSDGVSLDAWLAEAAFHPNDRWTVFARGEAIETDELGAAHHGQVEDAARLSLGAIRDFRLNEHAVFGVGAVLQQHFANDALDPLYGDDPQGAMAFVRLRIG